MYFIPNTVLISPDAICRASNRPNANLSVILIKAGINFDLVKPEGSFDTLSYYFSSNQ